MPSRRARTRQQSRRGEFFLPATADYIRRTLKTEFQGQDRRELRETIFETETQDVVTQKGIYYFVSGAGGKLRTGDIDKQSGITEKSYDRDLHFMLFEVAGDEMYFQAISRTGETIDSGVIKRR